MRLRGANDPLNFLFFFYLHWKLNLRRESIPLMLFPKKFILIFKGIEPRKKSMPLYFFLKKIYPLFPRGIELRNESISRNFIFFQNFLTLFPKGIEPREKSVP